MKRIFLLFCLIFSISFTYGQREQYDNISVFRYDVAKARYLNGKYGFIDRDYMVVVPTIYDDVADYFREKLAWVSLNGKYGFVNLKGEIVVPLKYDLAGDFNEKWGYINNIGQLITPIKYDFGTDFSGGLGVVMQNMKWGYINNVGKIVIPMIYDDASSFEYIPKLGVDNKIAKVSLDDKKGAINKKGQIIIPIKYKRIILTDFGTVWVKNIDDSWELMNQEGQLVSHYRYDDIGNTMEDGVTPVQISGKVFYIDTEGKCVQNCHNAPNKHPK